MPPEETCRWIIDVYAWLLANTGGFAAFEENPLVLPTDEFFPIKAARAS